MEYIGKIKIYPKLNDLELKYFRSLNTNIKSMRADFLSIKNNKGNEKKIKALKNKSYDLFGFELGIGEIEELLNFHTDVLNIKVDHIAFLEKAPNKPNLRQNYYFLYHFFLKENSLFSKLKKFNFLQPHQLQGIALGEKAPTQQYLYDYLGGMENNGRAKKWNYYFHNENIYETTKTYSSQLDKKLLQVIKNCEYKTAKKLNISLKFMNLYYEKQMLEDSLITKDKESSYNLLKL